MQGSQRFLLGPLEHKGRIAGWRVGQVLCAGIACLAALGVLALSTGVLGIFCALSIVVAAIVIASFPIRGRTIEEWMPVVIRYAFRHSKVTIMECVLTEFEDESDKHHIGVLADSNGALSVILKLESTGISLLDEGSTHRRVEGFGSALSVIAREGSVIDRASWTAWSVPGDGDDLKRDLRIRGVNGIDHTVASYRALIESVSSMAVNRNITLTLRARTTSRRGNGVISSLIEEAKTIARAFEDSGHRKCRLLGPSAVEQLFLDRQGTMIDNSLEERRIVLQGSQKFSSLSLNNELFVSWWIAEWPRHEVSAELLAPLLLGEAYRSISVTVEPVSPSIALRRAQNARTSGAADDELRRRGGFMSDRRRERESDHLMTRESELVDGHSSLRFAGYITVSASDEALLFTRAAETELAGAQSRLLLRRLQGDHARGYVATLPLGAGLP